MRFNINRKRVRSLLERRLPATGNAGKNDD